MDNDKTALRSRLLVRRRMLAPEEREAAAEVLAGHVLGLLPPPDGQSATVTVAAYVSVGAEPGTRFLLEALRSRGVGVLLPVLLPDNDLEWAAYGGPESLRPAARGLLEPSGPQLGMQAVCSAVLVLLPGLAVDRSGVRLGRGGGSYDRVLARLRAAGSRARLVTLLYEGELLASVPAEPHDHAVDTVVMPSGVHRIRSEELARYTP